MNNNKPQLTNDIGPNAAASASDAGKQQWQTPALETSKIKDLTQNNFGFGMDGNTDAFEAMS